MGDEWESIGDVWEKKTDLIYRDTYYQTGWKESIAVEQDDIKIESKVPRNFEVSEREMDKIRKILGVKDEK